MRDSPRTGDYARKADPHVNSTDGVGVGFFRSTPILTLISPGLHTLIVDGGRLSHRSLGVPLSGPADRLAYQIGNALVRNDRNAAALEVTLSGPSMVASCPLACVLYGAPFEITTDRRELHAGTTFTLEPGEKLTIGKTPHGARAYLCVQGGIDVPAILGSRTAFGPLRSGDKLPCSEGRMGGRFIRIRPEYLTNPLRLRVMPGPQYDLFEGIASYQFYGRKWSVTNDHSRMGIRLDGSPMRTPDVEIVSEPVCPGSVQVTREGKCIILGVDGQTIGGYPKIATVASADMDLVGQLRPGDMIEFVKTDVPQAEELERERRKGIKHWQMRLEL